MEYKLTYANRIGAVGSNCGCSRRRRQSQQRKALSGYKREDGHGKRHDSRQESRQELVRFRYIDDKEEQQSQSTSAHLFIHHRVVLQCAQQRAILLLHDVVIGSCTNLKLK
eukprot:scaffold857_cov88-Skeletonema_marinoi.AAC.2